MLSYEMPQELVKALNMLDLPRCLKLTNIAYNNYPREVDCIFIIILDQFDNDMTNIKQKLLIKLLKDYYFYLLEKNEE